MAIVDLVIHDLDDQTISPVCIVGFGKADNTAPTVHETTDANGLVSPDLDLGLYSITVSPSDPSYSPMSVTGEVFINSVPVLALNPDTILIAKIPAIMNFRVRNFNGLAPIAGATMVFVQGNLSVTKVTDGNGLTSLNFSDLNFVLTQDIRVTVTATNFSTVKVDFKADPKINPFTIEISQIPNAAVADV